jgi:dUTP pyrophosphatase
MNEQPKLKIYCKSPYATYPTYATEDSACFDIHACVTHESIKIWYENLKDPIEELATEESIIRVMPKSRVLIPTGIIMDIPKGYSVRLHSRSGLALKNGVFLGNCEGVIDSDYVQEVKVILYNSSDIPFFVKNGDRICQGELVKNLDYLMERCYTPPSIKTNRDGGFGSTGV